VSHLACDRISTRPSSFAKKSALRHGEARHIGGERIEDDHVDRLAVVVRHRVIVSARRRRQLLSHLQQTTTPPGAGLRSMTPEWNEGTRDAFLRLN